MTTLDITADQKRSRTQLQDKLDRQSNAFVDTLNIIATGSSPSRKCYNDSTLSASSQLRSPSSSNYTDPQTSRSVPHSPVISKVFGSSGKWAADTESMERLPPLQVAQNQREFHTPQTSVRHDDRNYPTAPFSESKKTPYELLRANYSAMNNTPIRNRHHRRHNSLGVGNNEPESFASSNSHLHQAYSSGDPLDVSFARFTDENRPSSSSHSLPYINQLARKRRTYSDSLFSDDRTFRTHIPRRLYQRHNEGHYDFQERQSSDYAVEPASYSKKRQMPIQNKAKQENMSIWLNPDTPLVLTAYMRIAFNLAVIGLLVWFVYTFITTVRQDIDQRVDEYSTEILAEIDMCTQQYLANKCMESRPPALEQICVNWEKCMKRDAMLIGRAKVSAETFGDIINSFLKPIGLKAMVFLALVFIGSLVAVNVAFTPHPEKDTKQHQRKHDSLQTSEHTTNDYSAVDEEEPSYLEDAAHVPGTSPLT